MGMMPPGMPGKPPEGWQPPMAEISWVTRKYLDLPYAPVIKSQSLDLFLPEQGDGPFPVLFQIHGGGFEMGDKRDAHLEPFLEGIKHGLAVATVNYRLSFEAKFPAAVEDVKAAVRWLRANQDKYHLDGNRIVACGGSAGANLASMLGTTGTVKEFDNPSLGNVTQSSAVQAVVSWFAPIDFQKMEEHFKSNASASGHPSFPGNPLPGRTHSKSAGAGQKSQSGDLCPCRYSTFLHPARPG
jgi:hypothetical protein